MQSILGIVMVIGLFIQNAEDTPLSGTKKVGIELLRKPSTLDCYGAPAFKVDVLGLKSIYDLWPMIGWTIKPFKIIVDVETPADHVTSPGILQPLVRSLE